MSDPLLIPSPLMYAYLRAITPQLNPLEDLTRKVNSNRAKDTQIEIDDPSLRQHLDTCVQAQYLLHQRNQYALTPLGQALLDRLHGH